MSAHVGLATGTVVVLAHGGGAPEALMVGVPVLMVAGLVLVERSARRKAREQERSRRGDA